MLLFIIAKYLGMGTAVGKGKKEPWFVITLRVMMNWLKLNIILQLQFLLLVNINIL